MFGFLIVTCHNFEIMFSKGTFIIAKEVECIISVVILAFKHAIRFGILEHLQEISIHTVFVEGLNVVLIMFGIVIEGIVHIDTQTFQRC